MRREWPRPESCGGSQPISSTEIGVSERSIGRVQDLRSNRLNSIIEPSVQRSSAMDDLPPPNTTRWVARRKAAVMAAVRSGRITMEEALHRYQISEEEYFSWQREANIEPRESTHCRLPWPRQRMVGLTRSGHSRQTFGHADNRVTPTRRAAPLLL